MGGFKIGYGRMADGPCKDCGERAVGCHGSCESYKTWKDDRAESENKAYKQWVHDKRVVHPTKSTLRPDMNKVVNRRRYQAKYQPKFNK